MKILILKPSSLGDVVQAIPVARLLKRHFPQSAIHWWIEKASAPLLAGDPDLAGLILFDRARWAEPWYYGDIWRCVREVRQHRFDLVIDLQALARSGAIAWLANGGFTIGLHDPREGAPGFYDASVPRPSFTTHAVDWYLAVLRHLNVPVHGDFDWLPQNQRVAEEIATQWPDESTRWIAMQPGARWENKRWPIEHFVSVAQELTAKVPHYRFAILGGKSDAPLGQELVQALPSRVVDLTGQTTLPQMVEWIRRCDVMITNDSGPMHVAAALRKPVVGLFGPTHPARTGPYGQIAEALQRHDLPCVPCMKSTCSYREPLACLRGMTPATVAARVMDRFPNR